MADVLKEHKEEKSFLKKILPIAGRVTMLLAIMFLIVYLVTVVMGSADFFTSSAERTALAEFSTDLAAAKELTDVHYKNINEIAEILRYAGSRAQVDEIISGYIGSPLFGDLRIYTQGKSYSANGVEVDSETSGHDQIEALSKSNTQGCTDIYFDNIMGLDCIAFFVPVRGSLYVDGLLSIVPARNVIDSSKILTDKMSVSILMDSTGKILSSAESENFSEKAGNNFYSFISRLTYDKDEQNRVTDAVRGGKQTACSINTLGEEYVIAMSPIDLTSDNLILVSISVSEGLIAPEMVYIRHIINLVVIAVISLAVGFVYAFFYYKETQKAIATASYTDPAVGCPNAEQLRISLENAITQKQVKYAVLVLEIRQFHYLNERFSEEEVTAALKYTAKVIETFCDIRESYGYLGDGRFAILCAYQSDKSIIDKTRLIETVLGKHDMLGGKAKKLFDVGACLAFDLRHHSTASELISHANLACDTAKGDINKPFIMYTEQVNIERERDERIEAEMESALANGEFRLFLQPKYNVSKDSIDSAEALVRWFDTKTGDYRFPGEFISLFESNGFITKLDHFMYIEALKCLSTSAERGERVVPISVNVSLVTASASDFLDFYIENKKKYRVGDGFIMIEFTESFAMGDHEKIREIVNRLHANGIKCSLDDFGTGYASFNVLKNIPIDELKLDRMFLTTGYSNKNDDTLLETVISLAKSLGIRVVQEGVETKEMFESVTKKGCDIIQGYYYAKAIPAEEYRLFIGSNTSIKYKSLVK